MATAPVSIERLSTAELTTALLGESLDIDTLLTRFQSSDGSVSEPTRGVAKRLWLGSIGYERHKDHRLFAQHVKRAGVERLIDVRELPISRRRGYAKSALGDAMAAVGVDYVHLKALGNPKPFRLLYKSGKLEEGRRRYEEHLALQSDALASLVPLLQEKRCALMCVEHDPSTCHRAVIVKVLRDELGLQLDVAELS